MTGGRVVFLDLLRDRYFCLPFKTEAAFLRLRAGEGQPGDFALLRPLVDRELLVKGKESAEAGFQLPPPTADFLAPPFPPAPMLDVLRALRIELGAAWLLRRRSFLEAIERARRPLRNAPQSAASPERLRSIISASAAAGLVLRTADRCLPRALAVHSLARRSGIRSRLVIGVRMNPFAAHCWAQLDERVLVGDHEQARLFTPILVAG
ncbi:MAG: lasso peptide biosynthesis B2 protein [Allosphingosinicella sp.]|uniref:lasso peptide biosynthesis B2 protein n=1 Tax=Allosphingosinicella sp. TaxID=2823234 RepID=UPI00393FA797